MPSYKANIVKSKNNRIRYQKDTTYDINVRTEFNVEIPLKF